MSLSLVALFMIMLVLVQRGRGGGLTGALGGTGGSSAFGAKAGDVFTRITIVTATLWILLCVGAAYWARHRSDRLGGLSSTPPASSTLDSEETPEGASLVNPPAEDALILQPAAGQPAEETQETASSDE